MAKIGIVGAGNVGANLAFVLLQQKNIEEITLYDIFPNIAEGKALDLAQSSIALNSCTKISFAKDLNEISNSDIVIVTAGVPRKAGMDREDLLFKNRSIIQETISKIGSFAPDTFMIIVSNPLDVMTYIAWEASGLSRNRIFGMAGVLDSARLTYHLSKITKIKPSKIKALVIGEHGSSMTPLLSVATIDEKPVKSVLTKQECEDVFKKTINSGACIVELLGTSAFFAPAMSINRMIQALLEDSKEIMSVSAVLEGEYGQNNIASGVPAKLGKNGIEEILELNLTEDEAKLFNDGCKKIDENIKKLHKK